MPDIYVDADACPVKDEIFRVAARHKLLVHVVGNSWLRLPADPMIRQTVVPEGPDAADDWIAENIGKNDIAVTADIHLAARCIERGAYVLAPTGKPFTPDNIGMSVAVRDLMTHLRDTGEITGGSGSFGKQDRSRFLGALEVTIQRAIRRD